MLPFIVYECETWPFTLSEEQIEDIWERGAEENI
jgi:hypothetical protein